MSLYNTNQQGITQILVVMLLLAGIALGTYLVQVRQIFHSKAVSEPIVSEPITPFPNIRCDPKANDSTITSTGSGWVITGTQDKCDNKNTRRVTYSCTYKDKAKTKVATKTLNFQCQIPSPLPSQSPLSTNCNPNKFNEKGRKSWTKIGVTCDRSYVDKNGKKNYKAEIWFCQDSTKAVNYTQDSTLCPD